MLLFEGRQAELLCVSYVLLMNKAGTWPCPGSPSPTPTPTPRTHPRADNLLCQQCGYMSSFLTCVRWNDCSSPPSGVGSLCQFHLYRKPSVWFGCVPDLCEKMAARSRSIVHVQPVTLSHNSLSPSFLPPVSAGDSKIVKLFPGSELDSSATHECLKSTVTACWTTFPQQRGPLEVVFSSRDNPFSVFTS